jgi:hypothetical protein
MGAEFPTLIEETEPVTLSTYHEVGPPLRLLMFPE